MSPCSFLLTVLLLSLLAIAKCHETNIYNNQELEDNGNDAVVKKEIIIPVEIWDVNGQRWKPPLPLTNELNTPAKQQRPRYVVAAIQGGKSASNGDDSNDTLLDNTQPATFDLGNPEQMILVVEYCRFCSADNTNGTDTIQNNCPNPISIFCHADTVNSDDLKQNENRLNVRLGKALQRLSEANTSFCTPSWPNGYIPASDLTLLDHPVLINKPRPAGDIFYPPIGSPKNTPNDKRKHTVYMQCFNGGSHSRYTIPAQLDALSFLDPHLTLNEQNNSDQITKMTPNYHFQMKNINFGALVRTVPQINRVWSNIGIGYRSQFLNSTDSQSILLDLSFDGSSTSNISGKNDRLKSHIIFNPRKKRYMQWPFTHFDVMHHRRVHLDVSIYLSTSKQVPNQDEKLQPRVVENNKNNHDPNDLYASAFHIDTGNDGISIESPQIQKSLAKSTGGVWISESKFKEMFNVTSTILFDSAFEKCTPQQKKNEIRILIVPVSFANHRRNGEDDNHLPVDLIVQLSPNTQVRILQNNWILPPPNPSSDSDEYLFYPTIFMSYGKNVLGLPFILATEGMVYDDVQQNIYIRNNYH